MYQSPTHPMSDDTLCIHSAVSQKQMPAPFARCVALSSFPLIQHNHSVYCNNQSWMKIESVIIRYHTDLYRHTRKVDYEIRHFYKTNCSCFDPAHVFSLPEPDISGQAAGEPLRTVAVFNGYRGYRYPSKVVFQRPAGRHQIARHNGPE